MKALTRSQRTRLLVSAVPALGVALVLTAASLWGLLAATRARVGDLLFTTRPAQSARSTVIVGIDEKSYQALLARDRKSTRLNSSHVQPSRMPSSA